MVDPTADTVGQAENQTRGFQRALDNYLKSTGQDPEQGSRKIADLLKRIDAKPLRTSGGRKLNQSLAIIGITVTLYSQSSWPALTRGLEAAEKGDGTRCSPLADAYNERSPAGHYGTQSHAQRAISCLDDKAAADARGGEEAARRRSARSRPSSGRSWPGTRRAGATTGRCRASTRRPEVSAPGAAPILVVGNTGDPATPYEGARRMADELGKGVGVELTWKGEGHGAYGSGSSCVDSTVNGYLLEGRIPRDDGKVCS